MPGQPDIGMLPVTVCRVSALTGEGLAELEAALLKEAGWEGAAEGVILARERHIQALAKARGHVRTSGSLLASLELVAEELRQAQIALAGITGEFTADDLLGEIFSRFCIGK